MLWEKEILIIWVRIILRHSHYIHKRWSKIKEVKGRNVSGIFGEQPRPWESHAYDIRGIQLDGLENLSAWF